MIDLKHIQKTNAGLARLAGQKFSFEADGLQKAMRKVGRRVPKALHRQAAVLIEAEQLAGHPKIRLGLDAEKVAAAEAGLRAGLEAVDPADRRKGFVLGLLGGLAFNLIAAFVLLVVFLKWRGFL